MKETSGNATVIPPEVALVIETPQEGSNELNLAEELALTLNGLLWAQSGTLVTGNLPTTPSSITVGATGRLFTGNLWDDDAPAAEINDWVRGNLGTKIFDWNEDINTDSIEGWLLR